MWGEKQMNLEKKIREGFFESMYKKMKNESKKVFSKK